MCMTSWRLAFPGITHEVIDVTYYHFLLFQRMFWIVCCIPFQVVMSTDTCDLFCSRFLHLPWLKHNSVTDAALAMRIAHDRTNTLLIIILFFLLQVSSLHHPASLPRNITGPCRLIPWLVPCFQVMRPTGQDSLRSRMRHMLWVSDAPTVRYTSSHGLSSPKAILHWDWMCRSEQQQVRIFYWTCQYFIVNC